MKRVLITGGGTGIGAAIAKNLYSLGYSISIIGRRIEKLKEVSEKCDNKIQYYQCDASNEENVNVVLDSIDNFDILINCAGIISSIEESQSYNNDELNNIININLKSTIMLSLKSIDIWKKQKIKGNIINIGSISAAGSKYFPIYASSKSGIIAFTKSIASRYGEFGIRCNVISPGVIKTPMSYVETPNFDDFIEEIEDNTPLKKLGNPTDIANVVEFLISEKSNFITGQEIIVDGGYSLNKEWFS